MILWVAVTSVETTLSLSVFVRRFNGFAKAGWGNDIKQTLSSRCSYEVRPDVDLNVYYGYDKYSVDSK